MNKILITGGAGYIGSHTCLVLLKNGFKVIVVDSFINSKKESLKRVLEIIKENYPYYEKNLSIKEGDIRDENLLKEIFHEENKVSPISAVVHFAGLKAVGESCQNPLKYWDHNLNGAINLLKVMKENNCKNIIFSSSASIYCQQLGDCIDEENPKNPSSPYGSTKYVIERLLQDLYVSDNKEWKIANLRYFNPIGAHSSGMIGEDPQGLPNNLFPLITKVALGKKPFLQIFGNDWPTRDGTCIRDYIHVMDLAEGHSAVLNYLLKHSYQFLNLNLGTGKGTSVLELLRTFEDINKVKIPYKIIGRRNGDVAKLVADNQLALKILNWNPKRDTRDMCKDGWTWQLNNPEGYRVN